MKAHILSEGLGKAASNGLTGIVVPVPTQRFCRSSKIYGIGSARSPGPDPLSAVRFPVSSVAVVFDTHITAMVFLIPCVGCVHMCLGVRVLA